mmetsp:Transcript_99343/g.318758  ORF Transcript_99343/g.318758 Transcript_99343/m.318758 type:complete len:233 (+) Transcript_99343:621-1319(+)
MRRQHARSVARTARVPHPRRVRRAARGAGSAVVRGRRHCMGPVQPSSPRCVGSQRRGVSNHDQASTCACDHDVQPAAVGEETDPARAIAPHRAEQDEFLLAALECIHGRDLECLLAGLAGQAPGEVHNAVQSPPELLPQVPPEPLHLGGVGRHDSDLQDGELPRGQDLNQDVGQLLHLLPIVPRPTFLLLLAVGNVDEGDIAVLLRPREAHGPGALVCGHAGLQAAAIESGG